MNTDSFEKDGFFTLTKDEKYIQCSLEDYNMKLFIVEYTFGDDIDHPQYQTEHHQSSTITAKIFKSFYLENDDYLKLASWKVSDWFLSQYPDYNLQFKDL
jgi:hypothetical protein